LTEDCLETRFLNQKTNCRNDTHLLFFIHTENIIGLVGSNEFVENYQLQLTERAVTYLNVDLIVGNGSL
jgi:hypothetical protein